MITSATFDLETSSLNADFGIILCGVIKPAGKRARVYRGDEVCKRWKTHRSDDSAIVKAIADELARFDILVAHNGARFDLPFLRTRMARWGLGSFPNKKLVDPVLLARNKLKMSYNSLERLGDFLGINAKTSVDGDLWLRAALDGDSEAMDYIVDHCVKDVVMLEKIVDAVKEYSTAFNTYGSGY